MPKYKFDVRETQYYQDTIEVEADTEEEARVILQEQLDEELLEFRKNTFDGYDHEISLIKDETE